MSPTEDARLVEPPSNTSVSTAEFQRTFRHVPGPVAVVLVRAAGDTVRGLTCTSATSLSASPPMAVFCADDKTRIADEIRSTRRYSINYLAGDRAEWAKAFARGGTALDRLAHVMGTEWNAVPKLRSGTTAVLECELAQMFRGGDHWIVTGLITGARSQSDATPLVYCDGRYGSFADVEGSADRKV